MATSQSFASIRGEGRMGKDSISVVIEDGGGERTVDNLDSQMGSFGADELPVMMVVNSHFPPYSETSSSSSPPNGSSGLDSRHTKQRPISFDELYDVTDESDVDVGGCPSLSSHGDTRSSAGSFTLSTASSTGAGDEGQRRPGRRNKYPVLFIPPTNMTTFHHHKNSPVPPTPPPKIPISPLVLSRLQRAAPTTHVPPSLAGSATSEQPSTFSSPQTPDLQTVPDVDWNREDVRVQSDSDSARDSAPSSASISPQLDIQLQEPEDWNMVLNRFPEIPAAARAVGAHSLSARSVRSEASSSQPSVQSSRVGVRLSSAAMETLQHIDLPGNYSQSSSSSEVESVDEMHELMPHGTRPKSTSDVQPRSATTGSSFSSLSIPSPGGFFSSLNAQSRRTWNFAPNNMPPTSATAERFYNCPWAPSQQEDRVVEHVLEYGRGGNDNNDDDDDGTEGPPTAKAIVRSAPQTAIRIPEEPSDEQKLLRALPKQKDDDNSICEYDEDYEKELESHAMENIDRTSIWIARQLQDAGAPEEENLSSIVEDTPVSQSVEANINEPAAVDASKKNVRFLEPIQEEAGSLSAPSTPLPDPPAAPEPKDPIFYDGFRHFMRARRSRNLDTFLHSNYRYEAVQAARSSMTDKHIDHLAGKYELSNPYRPPYRGPFAQAPRNSTLPQILADKSMFSNVEKEQDVLTQLKASTWAIDALKYLNGNRLIPSPAAKRIGKAAVPLGSSTTANKRCVRVLDLGGQTSCEWSWYLARENPNIKVYTAITSEQAINPGLKGPPNHRYVTVDNLWKLPFADNQFDLISARALHMLLKHNRTISVDGESVDEFDLCVKECFRCLKPRGYFEFLLMDSEIVRAGPFGSATSVEFGFNLKTRGYEPSPTKMFLSRLKKANFSAIKRAWLFLPLGSAQCEESQVPGLEQEGSDSMGSTVDVASITGLLGGWMWEQWMLKLQVEMGREKEKLLEEMAAVFEEGRKSGAGWRCLNGWAMKPKSVK